ncbi:MAG: DNA polymerase I [Trueperaceae bacterium]|nr:DNA polymerase I [Trueperaceae bacterium]
MKTFYLLDGHAQIFRAYYAPFRELTTPDGRNVKAAYVFTQLLLNLLGQDPTYFAVAFDVSDETTFRKDAYAAYKENRDATPEDLGDQIGLVRAILDDLHVPILERQGFEADDVIATIADRLPADVELRIVSKDKDLHQILNAHVGLYDPKDGTLLFGPDLLEAKGYTPEQAVEVQTLVGDATDNIPGVPGIGTKTAAKLVAQYGSADAVLAHAEEQTPKRRENLLASAELLPVTRDLVTLRRDVPMDVDLDAWRTPHPTRDDARATFEALGFQKFLDALPGGEGDAPLFAGNGGGPAASPAGPAVAAPEPARLPRDGYVTVRDAAGLEDVRAALAEASAVAIDTETTSLRAHDAEPIGVSLAVAPGRAWYLPIRGEGVDHLPVDAVLEALAPTLEAPDVRIVGQNLKYDLQVLWNAGARVRGPIFDTMIAAALLHPARRGNGLDALAADLLGVTLVPTEALIGKGKRQISMLEVPLDDLATYAAEDADATWRLYERLAAELDAAPERVRTLITDLEFPLVEVLARMERHGVGLDLDLLEETRETLEGRVAALRGEIQEAAGATFNPDSPAQLGEVLFDRLALRVVKRTKTGRSTDASVLETLAAESDHPLPPLVLRYRELTKLLGTYVAPLPGFVSPRDGRLHASFHQVGAATGRLSSSDPNIQNIPVRSDAGRMIRRAFVPTADDRVLLSADYSQVELRMLAHLSGDAAMREAFDAGLDVHAFVAGQVYGVPLEEVDDERRQVAKTVNFGIVYGQTAFGLARTLRIPQGDAAAFIEAYKARYPGIDAFLAACVERAEADGYVETILGRRRPVPEIASRNRNQRALGERLAINTVVQGSAADLIKLAMRTLDARLAAPDAPDAAMIVQVHDELVFDVARSDLAATEALAREVMTGAMDLDVPLVVDVASGATWADAKG